MTAQPMPAILIRALAACALALVVALGAAPEPASADSNQWVRSQPTWWSGHGNGHSNDWRRHMQWNGQGQHHHHHFNDGFHGCFNCGFHHPIFVFNGSGVFFSSPGFIVSQGHFIVRQPSFIVRQPTIIVGQPIVVVRQPIIFNQPRFAARQNAFIQRHPSLQPGQPMRHKPMMIRQMGGVRIISPGM